MTFIFSSFNSVNFKRFIEAKSLLIVPTSNISSVRNGSILKLIDNDEIISKYLIKKTFILNFESAHNIIYVSSLS